MKFLTSIALLSVLFSLAFFLVAKAIKDLRK
jgi:hypothetical protein